MPKSAICASCRRPCFHGILNFVRLSSSQATPFSCPRSSCDTSQGKIRGFGVPMPAHTGQFLSLCVKGQMHSHLSNPPQHRSSFTLVFLCINGKLLLPTFPNPMGLPLLPPESSIGTLLIGSFPFLNVNPSLLSKASTPFPESSPLSLVCP